MNKIGEDVDRTKKGKKQSSKVDIHKKIHIADKIEDTQEIKTTSVNDKMDKNRRPVK